jgi:4-amino-4-deoxy-L-arabinose transferase-like glycosyltransferase
MKKVFDWLTATAERRIAVALFLLCAMLFIPLAGNYGMWDPWETHYGEVARQMLERNDFVSQWWPGSPQDRNEFWSKPVLTFWLMAISMKLAGLEWGAHPDPAQIANSWRVEWAARLPFILLSIVAVYFVWELVRRLVGRRAAALSALVLATSSQWAFITRQAMTDMAFVSPMTIALALAGLALLLPEEEAERELSRGELRLGKRTLSYPRDRAFWGFVALFALTTLPQLAVIAVQLTLVVRLKSANLRIAGIVPMLPYVIAFFVALWWCARATNKRQLYLFSGYVLCALASLAKGPAGVALPALVLVVYLVLAGRWRDILFKLEIPRGVILFVATAFPWYHAMLIRHGIGFWNEFIGDNYVHRAGGRHGDRGTWDYYAVWTGYGMFPWSGLVALAGLFSFKKLREADPRRGLIGFALVWFLVEFSVMSLVNTKFHHYILPALPALAILTGVFLDDLLRAPTRLHVLGTLLVAAPITFLCGRDLAAFPPRLLWMFNYDYVNMPGTGRPWPLVSLYGDRYEYNTQIMIFALAATLATLAIGVVAAMAVRKAPAEAGGQAPPDEDEVRGPAPLNVVLGVGGAILVTWIAAILSGPSSPNGAAPQIARSAWMVPAALMLPAFVLFVYVVRRPGADQVARPRWLAVWSLGLVGVVWTGFILDKVLIELSPHWSQKHVIASYFAKRRGPEEPLLAWQLYWRGENFYTKNSIYNAVNPQEKTVFLGDHNAEKMQAYFTAHPGKRVFFVVERTRFESLRQLLPAAARSTLNVVDDSNNKIYLATAQLPGTPSTEVVPRP